MNSYQYRMYRTHQRTEPSFMIGSDTIQIVKLLDWNCSQLQFSHCGKSHNNAFLVPILLKASVVRVSPHDVHGPVILVYKYSP